MENRIRRHPKVTLHLNAGLVHHGGQVGAFAGTIATPEGSHELSYGTAVVATGGQAYVPKEYLYSVDQRVLTQVELSRRIRTETNWARRLQQVVMIQCVGSRNAEFEFCSRMCCSAAIKNCLSLQAINPDVQIVVLYRDLRAFGFKELYYLKARQQGALFFRYIPEKAPEVFKDSYSQLIVDFTDRSSRQDFRVEPDLVVLSAGVRPHSGAEALSRLLKLPRTPEGFFMEAHVKLQPLEFAAPGLFLAGLAHSPRFISESIAMAKAAALQAVKVLCKAEMTTPATVAGVDPDVCAACLTCVRCCPFQAPFVNTDGIAEIPPSKCRGCGICVTECPARAITLRHTTDDQLAAQIDGLLEAALKVQS
jgi:heterodisulfide reductase subunit A-like polyferredoxin